MPAPNLLSAHGAVSTAAAQISRNMPASSKVGYSSLKKTFFKEKVPFCNGPAAHFAGEDVLKLKSKKTIVMDLIDGLTSMKTIRAKVAVDGTCLPTPRYLHIPSGCLFVRRSFLRVILKGTPKITTLQSLSMRIISSEDNLQKLESKQEEEEEEIKTLKTTLLIF